MILEFSAFCVRAITKIILMRLLKTDLERQYFLVLRENQILRRRTGKRILFHAFDRHFLIAVASYSRKLLNRISIVQPETVVAWHRKFVLKHWHASEKSGRPPVSEDVVQLVLEMKKANRRWGMQRIHGELKKLKIDVSKRTIGRILKNHGFTPFGNKGIGWFNFLRSQKSRIYASDFFEVPTLLFDQLHVLFVIDVKTQEIVHWAVAKKPNSEWMRNQVTALFSWASKLPDYFICDNDDKYCLWMKDFLLQSYGIKLLRTPIFRPWFNCYAERMVRTFRNELINHVLIYNEKDLNRLMREYVRHYNERRVHSSLDFNAPKTDYSRRRRPADISSIKKQSLLGGLITEFDAAA